MAAYWIALMLFVATAAFTLGFALGFYSRDTYGPVRKGEDYWNDNPERSE